MAAMARETWTDERLDDLKGQMIERFDQVDAEVDRRFDQFDAKMNERFAQVDQRFGQVEAHMKEGFARVDKEIGELRGEMMEVRGDIKATQRLMVQSLIGICTLMGTGFAITITGIGILAL
jgi:uncharacterized protein (DUF885 family)